MDPLFLIGMLIALGVCILIPVGSLINRLVAPAADRNLAVLESLREQAEQSSLRGQAEQIAEQEAPEKSYESGVSADKMSLRAGMYVCYAAIPISLFGIGKLATVLKGTGVEMSGANEGYVLFAFLINAVILNAMATSFRILSRD